MTKIYEMALLHVMLERGIHDWHKPITATEVAPGFYQYLTKKQYRLKDWNTQLGFNLIEYDERKVSKVIADMRDQMERIFSWTYNI